MRSSETFTRKCRDLIAKGEIENHIKTDILPEQNKDRWVWGIFLKDNPKELIGGIGLWRDGHPENRGFWLSRKHWGQGLMSEAVETVMDFAFFEKGFEKLTLTNTVENVGSKRIKEKTGARFIKAEPCHFVDPALTECEVWELTKEDWIRSKNRKA